MSAGHNSDPDRISRGIPARLSDALLKVGLSSKRSIECAVAVICSINLLIFFGPFGADLVSGQSGAISNYLGPLVPFIWLLWFALMGLAFHIEVKRNQRVSLEASGILLLFVLCALYPVYTFGFRSLIIGLIANIFMVTLLIFLVAALWWAARIVSALLLPIAVWLVVASIWILADMAKIPF